MDEQWRASSRWSWWIVGKGEEEEGNGWEELIADDSGSVPSKTSTNWNIWVMGQRATGAMRAKSTEPLNPWQRSSLHYKNCNSTQSEISLNYKNYNLN